LALNRFHSLTLAGHFSMSVIAWFRQIDTRANVP
jgi:hypothetical protein